VLGYGQGIGHCTWLSEWRHCSPFRLTLHYKIPASGVEPASSNGKLSGEYALLVHDHAGQIAWSQKGQIPASPLFQASVSGLTGKNEVRAFLDKTGVLRVILSDSSSSSSGGSSKQEQLLWASASACKKQSSAAGAGGNGTGPGAAIVTYMPRLVLNSVTGIPMVICDRDELDTFSL
jgi:hypothetical protein